MKEIKKVFILDTSAILTYIEDEDGSDYVENLLIDAEKGIADIYVSFISLTEVFYITIYLWQMLILRHCVRSIMEYLFTKTQNMKNLHLRSKSINYHINFHNQILYDWETQVPVFVYMHICKPDPPGVADTKDVSL